ncbi:MAG: nucleoside 2-deoxyribosyltransferase, partial [Bacteroidetes bacterium]|nr:nucleoside 2-deoxyribosyltransferase [Bacteroidota bacterium]
QERKRITHIMLDLEDLGYEIALHWPIYDMQSPSHEHNAICAVHDMDGVRRCDMLIAICDKPYNYMGTLAEIGAALALGKPVIIVGNMHNFIFAYHPLVVCMDSVTQLMKAMEERHGH